MSDGIELRLRCRKPGCTRRFTRPQGSRRIYCTKCSPPRKPVDVDPPVPLESRRPPVEGAMVAAVRAELERCRAVGTMAGAIALRLALTLDDPDLAASSVASLSAQLVRTLEPLQRAAPREPDELDDLAAQVALIRGGAAG